ncbi:MAG TPA: hypothetical protein VFG30_15485, partial [Polyangiales bacterium]|nr:hypothetical protein [Polyangiales bacterium]
GGEATLENICLMCRALNALIAERDYGREFVKRRIADRGAAAPRVRAQARGGSRDSADRCEKTKRFPSGTPVSTSTIELGPEPGGSERICSHDNVARLIRRVVLEQVFD